MEFKEVNNKFTDSLILSLENLTQEYNIVLKSYNHVQKELDTYANSSWTVNPYFNTNIQFTTGEIAYVSVAGTVFLYSLIPELEYAINTDQSAVDVATSVVDAQEGVVSQDKQTAASAQQTYNNTLRAYQQSIAENPANSFSGSAALFGKSIPQSSQTIQLSNQLSSEGQTVTADNQALASANSAFKPDLNAQAQATSTLAEANLNYLDALNQLSNSGCPPISNVTQVNLPWLIEYNAPFTLIPTTPPLLSMGQFVFNYGNGAVGFNGFISPNNYVSQSGQGCDALNAMLAPLPTELELVNNTAFVGNVMTTLPNPDVPNATLELCAAICSSTPNCSGSTFNIPQKTCTLNSGAGIFEPSVGDIAIVPRITVYLQRLSELNLKLTDINERIVAVIKIAQPDFTKYSNDDAIDTKLLKNRYTKLIEERIRIDKMIEDIGKTQSEENYETDVTNMTYFRYSLLIALSIIVIIILVKVGSNKENASNMNNTVQYSLLFVILFAVVIAIAVYFLKKYVTGTPL